MCLIYGLIWLLWHLGDVRSRESSFKAPEPPKGRVTSDYNSIMGNDGHKVRLHSFSRLLINSWPQICAARGSSCSFARVSYISRSTLTKPRKLRLFPLSLPPSFSLFFNTICWWAQNHFLSFVLVTQMDSEFKKKKSVF